MFFPEVEDAYAAFGFLPEWFYYGQKLVNIAPQTVAGKCDHIGTGAGGFLRLTGAYYSEPGIIRIFLIA